MAVAKSNQTKEAFVSHVYMGWCGHLVVMLMRDYLVLVL